MLELRICFLFTAHLLTRGSTNLIKMPITVFYSVSVRIASTNVKNSFQTCTPLSDSRFSYSSAASAVCTMKAAAFSCVLLLLLICIGHAQEQGNIILHNNYRCTAVHAVVHACRRRVKR